MVPSVFLRLVPFPSLFPSLCSGFVLFCDLPVHFLDEGVELFSEDFHSFLCLLSYFLCVFQLVLQQFPQLSVFLFDFFVLYGFLHQGVHASCLDWVIPGPLELLQGLFQDANFGAELLVVLQSIDEFLVAESCMAVSVLRAGS